MISEDTLAGYPGPSPESVIVGMPIMDYKPDAETVTGLLQCMPFFQRPIILGGISDVSLARNLIVHSFLKSTATWLVFIDADIGFGPQEWCQLMDGSDPLVVGPYARKVAGDKRAVSHGLGFTRIHRKIFDAIGAFNRSDGTPLVNTFFHDNEQITDFFIRGAIFGHNWVGEDQGFYALAEMVKYPRQVRKEIKLRHFGRWCYEL